MAYNPLIRLWKALQDRAINFLIWAKIKFKISFQSSAEPWMASWDYEQESWFWTQSIYTNIDNSIWSKIGSNKDSVLYTLLLTPKFGLLK